jgi:hypothetical protein
MATMLPPTKAKKGGVAQAFGITIPDASWFGTNSSGNSSCALERKGSTDSSTGSLHCNSADDDDLRNLGLQPSASSSSLSSIGSKHGKTPSPAKLGKALMKKLSLKTGKSSSSKMNDRDSGATSPVSVSPSLTGTDSESVTHPHNHNSLTPLLDSLGMMIEDDEPPLLPMTNSPPTRKSPVRNGGFSWFGEEDNASTAADWQEEVTEESSFHQKLQRAQDLATRAPSSPRKKKVSAKEAYKAGFDYGSRDSNRRHSSASTINSAAGSSSASVTSLSRSTTSFGSAGNRLQSFHGDDAESVASSCSSHHLGIIKPDPLDKDLSGDREFIVPTVIMSSGLWKPRASRSSSIVSLDSGLVSPLATPISVASRLNLSMMSDLTRGESFSSGSSVGSNHSGYTHYSSNSRSGSGKRNDSIGRMIHASAGEEYGYGPPLPDLDDGSETGSIGSVPSYVSDLEQKVLGLEDKIHALADDKAKAKEERRRKKAEKSAMEERNQEQLMDDPSLSRLFVLLLEPVHRKFELIQVLTHLSVATVGDILQAIPENTTVPFMADQTYRAFCRPKDGIEMSDEFAPLGKVAGGWRVIRGEILIAIPQGYLGGECMAMAQPILHNPKLVNLLRRKDPLAPFEKKKKSISSSQMSTKSRSKRSSSSSSRTRSSSRTHTSKSLLSGQVQNTVVSSHSVDHDVDDESSIILEALSRQRSCNLVSVNEDETVNDEELAKDMEPTAAFMALQRLAQTSALCVAGDDGVQELVSTPDSPKREPISKSFSLEHKEETVSAFSDYGPSKNSVKRTPVASHVAQPNCSIQTAERELIVLRELAEQSYLRNQTMLECVAEGDDESSSCMAGEMDDDATITSEAWDERVRRAAGGQSDDNHLVGDLIDILIDVDEGEGEINAPRNVTKKSMAEDSVMFTCLGTFFVLLILRMLVKGLTGVEVGSSSAMGGKGVIFCAAMLKSLVHLQRVFEANRLSMDQQEEGHSSVRGDREAPPRRVLFQV